MRKDELLYLHQLLSTVRREYRRRDDSPPPNVERYDAMAVSPMAAHEPKHEHDAAVRVLAAEIASSLDAESGGDRSHRSVTLTARRRAARTSKESPEK